MQRGRELLFCPLKNNACEEEESKISECNMPLHLGIQRREADTQMSVVINITSICIIRYAVSLNIGDVHNTCYSTPFIKLCL